MYLQDPDMSATRESKNAILDDEAHGNADVESGRDTSKTAKAGKRV